MSPQRRQALDVARSALRRERWLDALPQSDRREIEDLATAVALRVAETLEALDAAVYNAPTSSPASATLEPIAT
jgi:hypothetical protein